MGTSVSSCSEQTEVWTRAVDTGGLSCSYVPAGICGSITTCQAVNSGCVNIIPCDADTDCSSHGVTNDLNKADGCDCVCHNGWEGADCSTATTPNPTDTFEDIGVGVCKSEGGNTPPNYSKNGETREQCEAACQELDRCIGYSFLAVIGRCAIWVDLEPLPAKTGWAGYQSFDGWNVGVDEIVRASGDAGWECYKRLAGSGGNEPEPVTTTTTTAHTTTTTTTTLVDTIPTAEDTITTTEDTIITTEDTILTIEDTILTTEDTILTAAQASTELDTVANIVKDPTTDITTTTTTMDTTTIDYLILSDRIQPCW